MADYAIVQVSKVGNRTIRTYMTKYGTSVGCFADSSFSCGRTFSSVSQAHYDLMVKYPRQTFEMVPESFIGKEND